jgi:tetrapyrrole methylase family protein/MazG family protein
MNGESFLERRHNSFDTDIPLYLYAVNDISKCLKKIADIYGKRDIESTETEIMVKPCDLMEKTRYTFGDLVEIIFRLRDPDGCMWDKAQNNMTIRGNAIEEAYELVEAVELNDNAKMREEFGDVLLQGIFNAIISEQENRFTANDVITELCQKLIFRHTHIFGNDKATNEEEALVFWEKAKAVEKKQKGVMDKIDSVPTTFSALLKANKVQKIIKKTGYDFPTIEEAIDKIYEEITEFIQSTDEINKESEGGDILFAVTNLLRMSHIDPEVALNGTTNRFINRFGYIVKMAEKQGKKIEELSLEEMEKFYQEFKRLNESK